MFEDTSGAECDYAVKWERWKFANHDWLCESVIRALKNDYLNRINDRVELKIPGAVKEYKSIDTVIEENDAINYTDKFLNTLELSGIPPHKLLLKSGSPVLLRNPNKRKLCNETRLSVKKMLLNVIEEDIINPVHVKEKRC
ncbi:ATP-dependent DNA helicase [Trichonephila inaurata madagascariensis]|uniref:ATP-dependent DNA helicase n=1 Tax=Trichonephila inaurata madagascariensis TaxID=2747483 RepID=A0A8X6Y7Z6_9ARAC|nr:ATP-dependent DNA helicase [Trichonephila inaurata madagascariensis]